MMTQTSKTLVQAGDVIVQRMQGSRPYLRIWWEQQREKPMTEVADALNFLKRIQRKRRQSRYQVIEKQGRYYPVDTWRGQQVPLGYHTGIIHREICEVLCDQLAEMLK